jgi:hypothetical protein
MGPWQARGRLLCFYTTRARLIWNSYAVSPTLRGNHEILSGFGTAMEHQSRTDHANPYSPLMCGLVLLMVFVAIQLKVFAVF